MDDRRRRHSLPKLGDVCLGTKPQYPENNSRITNKNISLLDIHTKYTAAFGKILQRTSGSSGDSTSCHIQGNKLGTAQSSSGLSASGIEFFKKALNLDGDTKDEAASADDSDSSDLEHCLKCTNISKKRTKRRAGSLKNDSSTGKSLKSQTNLTLSSVARRYPYYSPRPESNTARNQRHVTKNAMSHTAHGTGNALPVRLKPLKWKKRRFTMSDFSLQMSRLKVSLAQDDVIIREIDSRNSFAASEV